MKKKIINGFLMVALLFATASAFVSCKDNDADVNIELKAQMQTLQSSIQSLQSELANVKSSIPSAYDDKVVLSQISKLEEQLNALNAQVAALQGSAVTKEELAALEAKVDAGVVDYYEILAKISEALQYFVTSITAEGTYNPVFGSFALPTNNKTLVLASYVGNFAETVRFHGESYPIGQKYSEDAGKLYFTVNPDQAKLDLKGFSLVNSQDEAAKASLTVSESSDVLKWGWTRSASNGFYEASAKISDYKAVDFDYQSLIADIKTALEKRTNSSLKTLVISLYNAVTSGNHDRLTLKYQPNVTIEGLGTLDLGATRSSYDIALIAVKPLSYDFELELSDETMEALQDKSASVQVGTNESTKDGAVRYIDAATIIKSINPALQPLLLVKENGKIHSPYTNVSAGTITLIPTSSTVEIFAPAYKKYVKVECDGQVVKDYGVFDGSISELELTVESGKTYTVTYDAIDFYGKERNKVYTINVN